MSDIKNAADLTPEEIEMVLKARKGNEKKAYEELRAQSVSTLVDKFKALELATKIAKNEIFKEMFALMETAKEYGKIPKDTQSNYSFRSKDGKYLVRFTRATLKQFDERAKLGEALLKRFIENYVAEKAPEFVELIQSLLKRNKKGDYDSNFFSRLYAMKDKFDHQDWKDAIALFEESYYEYDSSSYINCYKIDETGKELAIQVNFCSIPVEL